MKSWISLMLVFFFSNILWSQEILLQEFFNDCMLPSTWNLTVTNDQDDGVIFGYPTNPNSDSLSIDGSCMVVFDDDLLGNNMPSFRAELSTPIIETKGYQSILLKTDIHFRNYESSTFTIYLEELDGSRKVVRHFEDGDQTGTQFSQAIDFTYDLTFLTESEEFRIVYAYDDNELYAWYAGIDNVEIIGSGNGETIVKEQFNDCELPADWETKVLEGESDWVFGEVNNENASSTSMNGSCFAYFDDDGIGEDAPYSTVELLTPWIDGSAFATFLLEFDLIFRRYADLENISVFVFDGESYTLVREFSQAVAGDQFSNYEAITIDLTHYRSSDMRVAFRYDDGNSWGWWTGIDNVKITGAGQINDICNNANLLEIGKACLPSSNFNAVFSGVDNDCVDGGVGSLWYNLIAPATGTLKISNIADYNDVISVYRGTCESLEDIACANEDEHGFSGEELYLNVLADTQYWVRVSGTKSTYGKHLGSNCLSAAYITDLPAAPSIDDKSNATLIVEGEECQPWNNYNASIGNDIPEGNDLFRSDIWFKFNSGDGEDLEINVQSEFAENVIVFNSNEEQIYNHDKGGLFVLSNLEPSTEYYIQIGGVFSLLQGEVCIEIKDRDQIDPLNNICIEAENMVLEVPLQTSVSHHSFSGVYPSCEIYVDKDYWLTFSTLNNVNIYLNADSDYHNVLSVYSGDCNDLTEIWCESNLTKCQGSVLIGNLQPMTTYYLQVSSSLSGITPEEEQSTITLSEMAPTYNPVQLSVSAQCDESGLADLNIILNYTEGVTLSGHSSSDIFEDGDEYIVVATTDDGCETSVKGTVTCQSTDCELLLSSYVDYPTCADGSNGEIQIEVDGGLGPYTYQWSNDDDDEPIQANLSDGTYTVTVTDARGCYTQADILLTSPAPLLSELSTADETQAGENNGQATLIASGGTLPYQYVWSNGETSQTVVNLTPGDYSVTITDFNGCSRSHEFVINSVDCVFAIENNVTEVQCVGGDDGVLSISNSNLTIEAYLWSTGEQTPSISGLSAGTYSVTVYADNGCNTIQEFVLADPLPIVISENINNVSCFGSQDGEVELAVNGGAGVYTYLWDDGSTEPTINNLSAGTYSLTVTDDNGCQETHEVIIDAPAELQVASSMASDVSCHDSEDGMVCIFVEGGTSPYNFDWNSMGNNISKLTDLAPGDYNLLVTDYNGCTLESQLQVNAPDAISVTLEDMSISDTSNGSIDISVYGGVAPYTYIWYAGDAVISSDQDLMGLSEGIYYAQITDANGCMFITSDYMLSVTGVAEVDEDNFSIYPNPAITSFTIESDISDWDMWQVNIMTIDGKRLDNYVTIDQAFDGKAYCTVSGNLTGMYMVSLESISQPEQIYLKPIIIMSGAK